MQRYDAALKILLQATAGSLLRQLAGVTVVRWLNVEMSQVQSSRVDLLGMTEEGELVHIELQSSNDPDMALRMAEYALRIYRQFRRFPRQIVLYVGEAPVRMEAAWSERGFAFEYALIDIRDLDAAELLRSSRIEDNLLAVLTRLQDKIVMVREILARIGKLDDAQRQDALDLFLIISGLRRLELTVREEARKMPILNDILDHQVLGPAIRQGLEQGRREGLEKGLEQGLEKGLEQGLEKGRKEALEYSVRRVIEMRFGKVSEQVQARLAELSPAELDALFDRALKASGLEELFPPRSH
jgi:predicted transposase YdaD